MPIFSEGTRSATESTLLGLPQRPIIQGSLTAGGNLRLCGEERRVERQNKSRPNWTPPVPACSRGSPHSRVTWRNPLHGWWRFPPSQRNLAGVRLASSFERRASSSGPVARRRVQDGSECLGLFTACRAYFRSSRRSHQLFRGPGASIPR
jgi:hypothetical protein